MGLTGTARSKKEAREELMVLPLLLCIVVLLPIIGFRHLVQKRMLSYCNFHLKVLFLNKIASYEVIALAWPCQYIVTILYAVNSDHIFTA